MIKLQSILAFTLCLIGFSGHSQKVIRFRDEAIPAFTHHTNKTSQQIELQFNLNNLHVDQFSEEGQSFVVLSNSSFSKIYTKGEPDLPAYTKLLFLPKNALFSYQITTGLSDTLSLADYALTDQVRPALASVSKSNDNENGLNYVKGESYQSGKFTGQPVIEIKKTGTLRNVQIIEITYHPLLYNASTNKLISRNDVKLNISFEQSASIPESWNYYSLAQKDESILLLGLPAQKSTNLKKTYILVSPLEYKTILEPFTRWKKQQGFNVIEAYLGEQIPSGTTSDIKAYLKDQYENPSAGNEPAEYILLVGDVDQIPGWYSSIDMGHYTDLYYAEYTGDYFPEVQYGRMSVSNAEQLQTIIEKTLVVEKGANHADNFQDTHLLIAGVDASYAPVYANGAINYFIDYYSNAQNNIVPKYYLYGSGSPIVSNSSAAQAQIIEDYNTGTGIAYYTAHCSSNGWANPKFEIANIATLTNEDKYPLMIGNCCQSLKYNVTSFGEEVVRSSKKGAVAYIGASADSYWDEDYFWGIGFTTNIVSNPTYEGTGAGSWDKWFHTHNETPENQSLTVGQILQAGNMAVEASNSTLKKYYWEIYNLIGDPSLIPPRNNYPVVSASYKNYLFVGQTQLDVTTKPNAWVSLSDSTQVLSCEQADANGSTVLSFNSIEQIGDKQVVLIISDPESKPLIDSLNVISSVGAYPVFKIATINDSSLNVNGQPDFGESIDFNLEFVNYGNGSVFSASVTCSSTSPWFASFATDNPIALNDMGPNGSSILEHVFKMNLRDDMPDQQPIEVNGTLKYNDSLETHFSFQFKVNAPNLVVSSSEIDQSGNGNLNGILDNGELATITTSIINKGSAQVSNTIFFLNSSKPDLLNPVSNEVLAGGFDINEAKQVQFNVQCDSSFFPGTQVDLAYLLSAGLNKQYQTLGTLETVLGQIPVVNISKSDTFDVASSWFYDSGGTANTYLIKENNQVTFIPHFEHEGLRVEFLDFDVETGTNNNCYDKLQVFDGTDVSAPLIGSYCNYNKPDIIESQNENGALTFRFLSDESVNKRGWEALLTSSKQIKVTFQIQSDTILIEGAEIKMVNQSILSDSSGMAIFDYIFSKGPKEYIISKQGFFDTTGVLEDLIGDTVIPIELKKLPTVNINVMSKGEPVENAKVVFADELKYTPQNGIVAFENQTSGAKPYTVTKYGFADTSGYITVGSQDICFKLDLRSLERYSLTFNIMAPFDTLSGVSITLNDSVSKITQKGTVIFSDLYKGSFHYRAEKPGYKSVEGDLTIIDQSLIQTIGLEPMTYFVSFTVIGMDQPVENAMITVKDTILYTSSDGLAFLENLLPETNIVYSVIKDNYNEFTDYLTITDSNLNITITLTPTGITDYSNRGFVIYPNPVKLNEEVNISGERLIREIDIYNVNGQLILKQEENNNQIRIRIQGIECGIYFMHLIEKNKTSVIKLVINP